MLRGEVRNSYSEVFELLKFTNREDLQKIPINLLETIKNNRNEEYIPNINLNNIQNSLSKKAVSLYTWLYLEYMASSTQKKEINKILYDNEIKKQSNLKINKDIFATSQANKQKEKMQYEQSTYLISYKQNFFDRLLTKIKAFFKL